MFVKEVGYQGKSCVYCQASVSLLSRKIKNKEKQTLKWIVPKELNNYNLLKSNHSFKIYLNNFIFPTAN